MEVISFKSKKATRTDTELLDNLHGESLVKTLIRLYDLRYDMDDALERFHRRGEDVNPVLEHLFDMGYLGFEFEDGQLMYTTEGGYKIPLSRENLTDEYTRIKYDHMREMVMTGGG